MKEEKKLIKVENAPVYIVEHSCSKVCMLAISEDGLKIIKGLPSVAGYAVEADSFEIRVMF